MTSPYRRQFWAIPQLIDFIGRKTSASPQVQVEQQGQVGYYPSAYHDGESVVDKDGVTHTPRPLYVCDLPNDAAGSEQAFLAWVREHHPSMSLAKTIEGVYIHAEARVARSLWCYFTPKPQGEQ